MLSLKYTHFVNFNKKLNKQNFESVTSNTLSIITSDVQITLIAIKISLQKLIIYSTNLHINLGTAILYYPNYDI
jgi:hypothetical protein